MDKIDCMIIVPHQDDETMMTGGLIHRLVNEGKNVKVVIATNGDYMHTSYDYGRTRIKESIEALELLGLSIDNIIFMGYADTGFEKEVSFLYRLYHEQDSNKILPSSCSQVTYGLLQAIADYHYVKWNKHATYNRKDFVNDLYHIMMDNYPESIYTTSKDDMHGDHVGLYYFVMEVIQLVRINNKGYTPKIYEAIVHSTAGDDTWPMVEDDNDPLSYHSMPYNLEETTSLLWRERISYTLPQSMIGQTKKRFHEI